MNIKIQIEESFTTKVFRDEVVINTEDYPELEGMTPYEIDGYIQSNLWKMKSTDKLYSSLGQECSDQHAISEDVEDGDTEIFVSEV
jgi:hypothetical protein